MPDAASERSGAGASTVRDRLEVTHIVALADERGSYGGPLAVALGQAAGLAEAGHDVVVLAGGDKGARPSGLLRLSRSYRVIPNGKPSGRFSPALVLRMIREARRRDVVHVHLGRDLTTLLAAYVATFGTARLVVQTHGMLPETDSRALRLLDRLVTRRVLARAQTCFALTDLETAGLERVSRGRARIQRLGNGIRLRDDLGDRPRDDEVLFLSRLAERKRPVTFVRMAHLLAGRGAKARFTLVGADEGQLAPVLTAIAEGEGRELISYEGAVPPSLAAERLARAKVLVLPSVDEPFPMVVLESMAVGTPVVVTSSCHIADRLRAAGAAWVSDGSPADLADAVWTLLAEEAVARRQRAAARRLAAEEFSIGAVMRVLLNVYDG
jgi:glycosyltransferase involved in cell wall biosynthesis